MIREIGEIHSLKLLYESKRSKLFTGSNEGGENVLIKEDLTGDLGRLHNEAMISNRSPHAGFNPQVILYNSRVVMVREFLKGNSLNEIIDKKPLSIDRFLHFAIKICHQLQEIHTTGTLHNDLNPRNIIIDEEGDSVRLIDFEFGTSIQNLELQFEPLSTISGTIEYISPEQTGRMNRKLDQRSDYYSLGATFYEMLTGQPPFEGEDVLAIIHCHLAIQPIPPSKLNPEVPQFIDKIVLKLLAKNAEERYQSIPGLLADLNLCQHQLKKDGSIKDAHPGLTDIASKLHISQHLYGRDQEVGTLKARFADACLGKKILMTIGGFSGVGKSVLCQELYKEVSVQNGLFLSGAFDVLDRQTPYLAFIKAFRQFAEWLMVESQEVQQYWAKKLNRDLKGLGQIIVDMAPKLRYILPPQPELVSLTGFENQQRIQFTINAFLQSLASEDTPLVLFLDDYQWANDASIELLKSLFNNYNLTHLMVLVAYRDNETPEFHPFSQAIRTIKSNNLDENHLLIEEIHLQPLSEQHVGVLISDTLKLESLEVAELTELIYSKTKGNPFSINKFLESLYKNKLLEFDYTKNKWTWSIKKIQSQNLSDDIVELLLLRIRELPENALQVIKAASVFGIEFSLNQLAIITGKPTTEIHSFLWPLIQEGSLIPLGNDYKFIPEYYSETNRDIHFRFAHARIQQAVYALLESSEKSQFHFEVGQIYLQKLSEQEIAERPIEIALHYSLGYDEIVKSTNKEEIGWLLLKAGKKSAESASFEGALNFTEIAFELLGKKLDKAEKFQLLLEGLEYSYLLKDTAKQEKFEKLAFGEAESLVDRVLVNEVIVRCLGFANLPKKAVDIAQKALEEVGISIPDKATKLQIMYHAIMIQVLIPRKKLLTIKDITETEDPLALATFKLLLAALSSYFFVNISTYPILIFQMLKLTIKKGMAPESVVGIASYGLILTTALKKPADGYEVVNNSMELLNKPDRMKYAATINMMYVSFTSHIKNNIVDSIPLTYEGYLKGLEYGNMEYACWNLFFSTAIKFHVGTDYKAQLEEAKETEKFSIQYNFSNQAAITQVIEKCLTVHLSDQKDIEKELKGLPKKLEENYKTAVKESNHIYLLSYFGYIGATHLFFGKYSDAFEYYENLPLHIKDQPNSFFINYYKINRAINAVFLMNQIREEKFRGVNLKEIVSETISELKYLSKLNPISYGPYMSLLKAGMDYQSHQKLDVETMENSISQLKELQHPRYYILFAELLSILFKYEKNPRHEFWRNQAASESRKIGVEAKSIRLLQEEDEENDEPLTKKPIKRGSISSSEIGQIDTKTLVKTMEALVSEIKLEALLEKLITYAMENTGAQEGHFLINREGKWILEVSTIANHQLHTHFPKVELDKTEEVSASIINYSKASKEPLLIEDALLSQPFDTDPIVREKSLRSVLCIPFINQSKISGIIYLTHSLNKNAFSKEQISLMRLMAAQIGGVIENALLYENMERLVTERTRELEEEKRKSDALLLNILPKEIASELIQTGKASARLYEKVSVMFVDIKDFTRIAQRMNPDELVQNLQVFFTKFDEIMDKYGIEKIKTIGDAYMAAGGIPSPTDDHAFQITKAAQEILSFSDEFNEKSALENKPIFNVRIGIHIGPVVAGVVGHRKFAYDIWGDTVNIASRMESNSETGKINVSEDFFKEIKDEYSCEFRGEIDVKNKGMMNMYFIQHPKNKEHIET
ncbi:MAG: AAA family ATPase [Algoriphagus sp.]|uniref:adenylate/guanylate cyclase domain-containing protein n=1 Tax=Algoriphagus sp. TaxID=1872435 RepID=UPI00185BB24F|nr:adenylate/guanylate cyclase domain-containing protein [Algoriphagus sp.]NVJ85680.1 AAA family ATPase [Algoriphagus sp.]